MTTWILAYLLIGDATSLAFYFWAAVYCWRFVGNVRPRWTDLLVVFSVQLLWPIAAPVLLAITTHHWRRAVRQEVCVCGHTRGQHSDAEDWAGKYDRCLYKARSARWLVDGEGEEFTRCECPRFTRPNVRLTR